jgi:hypothetical protein
VAQPISDWLVNFLNGQPLPLFRLFPVGRIQGMKMMTWQSRTRDVTRRHAIGNNQKGMPIRIALQQRFKPRLALAIPDCPAELTKERISQRRGSESRPWNYARADRQHGFALMQLRSV